MNMTNFEKLSEEEKVFKALDYSLMWAEDFLSHGFRLTEEERFELKAMIDWIAKKTGQEHLIPYLY